MTKFSEIKKYLLNHSKHAVESIIDSTEPFVMDYIQSPFGFAETDNVDDIEGLVKDIDAIFYDLVCEPDGRIRRGLVNHTIKREKQRWLEGRNATTYGRHIARLGYLLNKNR